LTLVKVPSATTALVRPVRRKWLVAGNRLRDGAEEEDELDETDDEEEDDCEDDEETEDRVELAEDALLMEIV
jgi:hypothetical protein